MRVIDCLYSTRNYKVVTLKRCSFWGDGLVARLFVEHPYAAAPSSQVLPTILAGLVLLLWPSRPSGGVAVHGSSTGFPKGFTQMLWVNMFFARSSEFGAALLWLYSPSPYKLG